MGSQEGFSCKVSVSVHPHIPPHVLCHAYSRPGFHERAAIWSVDTSLVE